MKFLFSRSACVAYKCQTSSDSLPKRQHVLYFIFKIFYSEARDVRFCTVYVWWYSYRIQTLHWRDTLYIWDALPRCGEVHSMRVLQPGTSFETSLNVPSPTSPIIKNVTCRSLRHVCPTLNPEFEALRCAVCYSTNGSFWRRYVLVVDLTVIPLEGSAFVYTFSKKYIVFLRSAVTHY